jgi:hypothetical protein
MDAHAIQAATVARLTAELAELQREFDIVDSAAEFWKEEAITLGYEE